MLKRSRLFLIFFAYFLVALLFSFRLYHLQVRKHKFFLKQVEKQVISVSSQVSSRGIIYDCNRHPLAVSVSKASLCAWPKYIDSPEKLVKRLAPYFPCSVRKKMKKKLSSGKSFVYLARKFSWKKAKKIKELKLGGVEVVPEYQRTYPEGNLAWHLLGRVSKDNRGLSGVEYAFEKELVGRLVKEVKKRDNLGERFVESLKADFLEQEAKNIVLTIDKKIQYIVERELEKTLAETKAKKGIVIVQEPTTGAILACACRPIYSREEWAKNPALLSNPAISSVYELGSVFKIVPAAAALEKKLVKVEEKFHCENGEYKIYGVKIHDHEKWGRLTFQEIMERSSNIGIAKVGMRVGKEDLYHFIYRFGFGNLTGIELPGESRGLVLPLKKWSKVSLPIISFGHGIAVTPLQMISAYSALANGGKLMQPYVLKEIIDNRGKTVFAAQPQMVRQVISPEVNQILVDLLEKVVEKGTGREAKIEGWRIAGKTGTAEKIDPQTGEYLSDCHIASFCGFFPLPSPRLTVLVIIDEPQGLNYWGGTVAAPLFKRISKAIIDYLVIPPSEEKEEITCAQVKRAFTN